MNLKTVLLMTLVATAALAHPGHGDDDLRKPATEADVRAHVAAEVKDLADAKKIVASWKTVPLKRLEKVNRAGATQWLAAFVNPQEKTDGELFLFANVFGAIVEGGFALDEKAAAARTRTEVERLIAVKKLADSWGALSPTSFEKRPIGNSWEWVVVIENSAAPDNNKKLFVFLKPYGDFVAANFTGK